MEPDVFEYDQTMDKPVFDLIIGCNSMEKLDIVMDFKTKSITIDEIILPMRNIANLTNKSKVKEAWAISNALAHEPLITELATQCAVKILDANYKKADLQAVVTNCTQLNSVEQKKATRAAQELENQACLLSIKGWGDPLPWQSFSDTQSTQGSHHERNSEAL